MIESTPRPSPGLRLTPQLVFGLLVIAAGVLFTLDNLGIVYAENYTRFWPTGLIAIGLLKLSQTRRGPPAVVSMLMVVLGGWLLVGELTEHRIRFGEVWPSFGERPFSGLCRARTPGRRSRCCASS